MTDCAIDKVMGDLKRLFESYRYRACMTSGRKILAPGDAIERERREAEALLFDPKLRTHIEACSAQRS